MDLKKLALNSLTETRNGSQDVEKGVTATAMETTSMEWKDSGDISNVNPLQREVLREPDYRCISPNMFGDTITEQIRKG